MWGAVGRGGEEAVGGPRGLGPQYSRLVRSSECGGGGRTSVVLLPSVLQRRRRSLSTYPTTGRSFLPAEDEKEKAGTWLKEEALRPYIIAASLLAKLL